ncbi:MAG TPA: tetratricopeptide repeat protein [Pyrinomonadaceae bacterium]|jgi:tetratricopeptide (TPR) repeat protein
MTQKTFLKKPQIIFLFLIVFLTVNIAVAQNRQNDKELTQALEFVKQNRLIDALPLLEKSSVRYPDDAEIQAHLGVAILVNAATLKVEEARKKEVARAGIVLRKAKKLGTENIIALHYLDKIEDGDDVGVAFDASSKEVEDAIREGEGFFNRGEYEKALVAYERAFKLDPKSYDAAVFAGDSFYAQKKYKESESWFAKAVAIDANREQAFRFWADALVHQGKTKEALVKFADAFIADPNSRLVADTFLKAVKNFGDRRSSPFVVIPSKENESEIVIDAALLKESDGTASWHRFSDIRKTQIENFNKVANGRTFSSTVSEDVEALKAVALAARGFAQKNKSLALDKSLENLIKLDSLGMLDVYTIFFIHGGARSGEYEKFREKNRDRMRKFLIDYFAEDKL